MDDQGHTRKKRNKHCKSRSKRFRKRKEENKRGYRKKGAWILLGPSIEPHIALCSQSTSTADSPGNIVKPDDVSPPEQCKPHTQDVVAAASFIEYSELTSVPEIAKSHDNNLQQDDVSPPDQCEPDTQRDVALPSLDHYNYYQHSSNYFVQDWPADTSAFSTPLPATPTCTSTPSVTLDVPVNMSVTSTPLPTTPPYTSTHFMPPSWCGGSPDLINLSSLTTEVPADNPSSAVGVAMRSMLLLEDSDCCDFPADVGTQYQTQVPQEGMRTINTAEGQVRIFDIPANGSCLFLALSHQLYGHPIGSDDLYQAAVQLTSLVPEYLRSNLPRFYYALSNEVLYWGNRFRNVNIPVPRSIYDLFEPEQCQEVDFHTSLPKILQYLDDLKKDGEIWGSHECLIAVAEKFKVAIEVHTENAARISIAPITGHEAKIHISHRRYSPTTIYPDHYDSVEHNGIGTLYRYNIPIDEADSHVPTADNHLIELNSQKASEVDAAEGLLSLFESAPPPSAEREENAGTVNQPGKMTKTLGVRPSHPIQEIPKFTPVQPKNPLTLPLDWITRDTPGGSVCAKVSETLAPVIRVVIDGGVIHIEIYEQTLPSTHPFMNLIRNKTMLEICNFIDKKYKVCPGVESKKYSYLWERTKTGVQDHQAKTFRSKSCSLLLKKDMKEAEDLADGNRCLHCKSLWGALRTAHSRQQNKENNTPICPQKRPHCSMNLAEKDETLKIMAKKIKNLNNAQKNISKRLQSCKENGIDLKDLGATFHKIMEAHKDKMTPMQKLFWEMQCKALSAKGASGIRWHPMMVRLAISWEAKGPGNYDDLRKVVQLPCKTTLQDYTHLEPEKLGIRHKNIKRLLEKMPQHGKGNFVGVMFDEMHIREGVVFDAATGDLVGYTNIDKVEEEIERLDANDSFYKPKVAKQVLVYMAKQLTEGKKCKEVVAIYATLNAKADQIYSRTWAVIEELEYSGLQVVLLICDGAKVNRKFFRIFAENERDEDLPFKTKNIFSDDNRDVFFMSDVPHLIKCLRNNFSEDKLWKNGQNISWGAVRDLYEKNKTNTFRRTCKLTQAHVELNNFSKMKVHYAAQVMSATVAHELELVDPEGNRETIQFIRLVDRLFDCMNGRHSLQGKFAIKPDLNSYTDINDPRFQFLQEVVKYFNDWKEEVRTRRGRFSDKERKQMTITPETRQGIEMTVNGFTGLVRFLLSNGITYRNARDANQDDLEQYFGKQREKGKLNNNPTVKQVLHNDTKNSIIGDVAGSVKNANTKALDETIAIDATPLPRRRRKRN